MTKKQKSDSSSSPSIADPIRRRDALKKLGALAICAPTLASVACDDDPDGMGTGTINNGAGAGIGGSPGGTSGGGLDAGPTGTAGGGGGTFGGVGGTTGSGGTTGGGTTGGGTTGGGTTGGMPGGGPADAGMGSVVDAGAGDAGAGSAGFFPPMFQDAGTCSLTPPDSATEGPFFIHEDEVMTDPTLVRADLRDGHPGVELQLNLRLLDYSKSCMEPIPDVEVYIWHTDAVGMYSGFNGQNPDAQYMGCIERTIENGERFCRGAQITNAQGVVSFRTLYPGWYFGRPIHIHFVALRKGSSPSSNGTDPSYRSSKYHMFTTQMYFEETFSRRIHQDNAPYNTRTNKSGYAMNIGPGRGMVFPSARMEGNVAVASLNIITSVSQSRGVGGGLGGLFGC